MKYCLALILALSLTGVSGQLRQGLQLQFDFGYRRALRLDGFQSELYQRGHWLQGGFGFFELKEPWFNRLEFSGHAGWSRPGDLQEYSIRDYGGECFYELLIRIYDLENGGRLYSGLSSLTDLAYTNNTRLGNNSWSWRLLSGFGPGVAYIHDFTIKSQGFQFIFEQHIPLVVYGSGPTYVSAIVADEEDWEEWSVLGLNQIWRSQFALNWVQESGNAFGLRYIWSYGRLNSPNAQHWAFHHLGLIMHVAL